MKDMSYRIVGLGVPIPTVAKQRDGPARRGGGASVYDICSYRFIHSVRYVGTVVALRRPGRRTALME